METFRILNDMPPPPPVVSDLVNLRDCSTYNFRYKNDLQVPQVCTTNYVKKRFRFAAAVLWNSFPDNLRQVSSFMSYSCSKHVIKYCEKVNERSGKNLFWSI